MCIRDSLSSSAGIKIPGNFEIKCEEKKLRLKKFHQEYHCNLAKFVKEKKKNTKKFLSYQFIRLQKKLET